MPNIPTKILQAAIVTAEQQHIQNKALLMEQIQNTQPVLFESITMQRDLGHDPSSIQVLFDILLVIGISLESLQIALEPVTQQDYIFELQKLSQHLAFTKGLTPQQRIQVMQQYHESHREPDLLDWVQQTMAQSGFSDMGTNESKQLTLAGITLVNCIATASTQAN